MLFLLLFTAVALGAVTVVCLPLLRGVPAAVDRGYFDRVVYRDQLKEVDRDLARGVLSPAEADSARLEIQRRLLAVDVAAPGGKAWSAPSPRLAILIALLVLGGSVGLYLRFGAPSLPDAPFAGRFVERTDQTPAADAAPHLDMRQAAQALEQKLHADPSNGDGWVLYARTESMLGDYQKAGVAYRQAISLGQKSPDVLAGYGEMLVLSADGIVPPAAHDTFTEVLAADPKLMELAYGRVIFDTYGAYAADPAAVAVMLDQAVADMQARAAGFAGRQRDHTPTREHPFTVVLVDEVAFLTAYQPDRKLKERIMLALATLTTQGRALGYAVVAALQDPRKDVLTIRNLFPDRIAMRLDEPEQVDMVLGDGARDRGAACELISTDPATGAGVAFIRVEADPDPVRVRAGWVTDADIRAMADQCLPELAEWEAA